ncbi:MAG: sugar phosphate isomerase/epimerase [Propionibacteriaceae bacterium]|jgi:sugar phosphate isomerase/epimerase|nr:sugar phosphate isomerase/epimerase [Propionibacteriaceae bacterium]
MSNINDVIRTMKTGFVGWAYPPPDDVPAEEGADWQIRRSAELGATCVQVYGFNTPKSDAGRKATRELAESLGIELEGAAFALFPPMGETPESRIPALRAELEEAVALGMTVVRAGWGNNSVARSRWAKDGKAQYQHMIDSLKSAAPLAEEYQLPIAVENHSDFFGWELANILRAVDSPWIGAALDTANGFASIYDPEADNEALAELAFTTHIKDMRVIDNPLRWAVPHLPVGCHLGEGNVDVVHAIEILAERSPKANGLHLIVEAGWEPEGDFPEAVPDPLAYRRSILEDGIRWLNDFIASR